MEQENVDICYKLSKAEGFSLIEFMLVLMISGIIMLTGAGLLQVHVQQERFDETIENIEMTQNAMTEFYMLYGRYPCPADPNLPSNHAQYGQEQCRVDPSVDPCPAGLVCTTQDSRDADADGNPDPVMIGMVPVRTLTALDVNGNPLGVVDTPFREYHVYDGFDTRLTYGVSENMTNAAFDMSNPANVYYGSISVVDENNISLVEPPGSAHYVIVSHGDNGEGGYTRDGSQIPSCLYAVVVGDPPGAPAAGLDSNNAPREIENCDYNDAIFRQAIRSTNQGLNYNDDVLYYAASGLRTLWRRVLSPDDPSQSFIVNTNLENVGVGIQDPQDKLHIAADISAENSFIADQGFCLTADDNTLGTDDRTCLPAEVIAGNEASMRCPAGQVAYAIGDDNSNDGIFVHIFCRPVFDSPPTNVSCDPGEFLVGLIYDNTGNTTLICEAP